MDECIDTSSNAKIVSTLDCNAGYWHTTIDELYRDKTAFLSHHSLFRSAGMPFGLTNAPDTFQRAIDTVLSLVLWKFDIVYLDDIIVF